MPNTQEKRIVKISWRVILKWIKEALHLPLLQFGSGPGDNSYVTIRGYIEISLPCTIGDNSCKTVKFIGDSFPCYQEAMKNIAEKVVRYLQKNGLVILDASSEALKSVQRRVQEAEEAKILYANILEETNKSQMKKVVKLQKMYHTIKDLVLKFDDILSIRQVDIDIATGSNMSSGSTFVCTATKPYKSRYEQMSHQLTALPNELEYAGTIM